MGWTRKRSDGVGAGRAELSVVEADGAVNQKHFDDIRNPRELGDVLSHWLSWYRALDKS
jgi:hypothetical protein